MCVCMYACMYACMYVCMYACMHVCMYVCMHALYACMYVCMHACVYTRIYIIHTRTRTYTHTHTHTPICIRIKYTDVQDKGRRAYRARPAARTVDGCWEKHKSRGRVAEGSSPTPCRPCAPERILLLLPAEGSLLLLSLPAFTCPPVERSLLLRLQ